MTAPRIFRYRDSLELAAHAGGRLSAQIARLQRHQDVVHLCLTGGPAGLELCHQLAALAPSGIFDATRIHLWWPTERFVDTTDPVRFAFQTLSVLAATMPLVPSHIHAMPPRTGTTDPDDAAFAYAEELGATVFDCCLLDVGEDGHVASIFPRHSSFEIQSRTSLLASGVTDAPYDPPERVTLNFSAINRSREVWLFASGADKRGAVRCGLAGDPRCPATYVHGVERTLWFVDEQAAADLPYFRCDL